MSNKQSGTGRLPRNFHRTFKPERHYINALMRFAASGKSGDLQAIAGETGIPMGSSSGKAPAIIDYCRGMRLIKLAPGPEKSSIKVPELTEFGRVLLLEDPFLKLPISQWLSHFNLCNSITGADVWYQVFFHGAQALGQKFDRDRLETHLKIIYGPQSERLIGPIIGMYEDEAAFKLCGALKGGDGLILKNPAPVLDELCRGYGAWILQLINDFFPGQQQVSVTDLDKVAGWRIIPGWSVSSAMTVLEILEQKAMVTVDRHMEPWLIQPTIAVDEAWRNVYSDMI
ncbi:conserved hypothetical protein [Candidatus Desulfarcum epimagneticum]|uniref:Uncharacterized protein n=1 Tax=uncultured Desulfobacteraceae bacterium TaxID=218296 RepID=A0A484HDF9_9BACT|nr:conserved hypothetical protein [uncultured Desulfobacteraceae bacterium]